MWKCATQEHPPKKTLVCYLHSFVFVFSLLSLLHFELFIYFLSTGVKETFEQLARRVLQKRNLAENREEPHGIELAPLPQGGNCSC
jgi:hypothetical protein